MDSDRPPAIDGAAMASDAAMSITLDRCRGMLGKLGFPVTRALIVLEIDVGEDMPVRVAGSWPHGETDEAAELAEEGAVVLRLMGQA